MTTDFKNETSQPVGTGDLLGGFVFGEPVECKTYGEEWLTGFFFLAHVPQLYRPFLVRAAIEGNWCGNPPRLHAECRRPSSPNTKDEPTPRRAISSESNP